MHEPSFPCSLELRLDWSEMDLYGHINNVSYFKYLQASRVAYWEQTGMTGMHAAAGIGPTLASTRCDFRKPLHYPGTIVVRASIIEIRRTSFQILHRIFDAGGAIAAEGNDIIVLFDYHKNEKVAIPPALRKRIETLEGRHFRSNG